MEKIADSMSSRRTRQGSSEPGSFKVKMLGSRSFFFLVTYWKHRIGVWITLVGLPVWLVSPASRSVKEKPVTQII